MVHGIWYKPTVSGSPLVLVLTDNKKGGSFCLLVVFGGPNLHSPYPAFGYSPLWYLSPQDTQHRDECRACRQVALG